MHDSKYIWTAKLFFVIGFRADKNNTSTDTDINKIEVSHNYLSGLCFMLHIIQMYHNEWGIILAKQFCE